MLLGRAQAALGVGRRIATFAQRVAANPPRIITPARVAFAGGVLVGMPVMTGDDFFEHKFITNKNPDDICDFYSTEDFLQILGIFSFAIHFVLSGVQWDTNKENTMTVHNAMEISFEITEKEEETDDGEKVVAFFQKRERFKNFIPFTPFVMWDQVQCYGYNRLADGRLEVFHRGEYFNGPLPARFLIMLHARYVIWATQKHINSPVFGSGDLEMNEEQRSNIPMHVVTDFFNRLYMAQQIAIESGKLAAGTSTENAEKTLKTLKRLKHSPSQAYINKKSNMKRTVSQLEMADPESQSVVNAVLANLNTTPEGRNVAKAALDEVLKPSEMEVLEPRYAGAFKGRALKMRKMLSIQE